VDKINRTLAKRKNFGYDNTTPHQPSCSDNQNEKKNEYWDPTAEKRRSSSLNKKRLIKWFGFGQAKAISLGEAEVPGARSI